MGLSFRVVVLGVDGTVAVGPGTTLGTHWGGPRVASQRAPSAAWEPRPVHLDVLGPVRVRGDDGEPLDLGTPRQRAIVAALALSEGRVLPVDSLVERVWWGEPPPPTVTGTLQSYVGGLRRVLEPDRRPRQPATVLVTEHDGYALRVARHDRDDVRLADAAARARTLLDAVPDHLRPRAGRSGAAACREALALLEGGTGRVARHAVRRPRRAPRRRRRAHPAARPAHRDARAAGGGDARAGPPRRGDARPRGDDARPPAARALVDAVGRRAGPRRPAGRRPGRAAAAPLGARRRARRRAERAGARPADRDPAPGPDRHLGRRARGRRRVGRRARPRPGARPPAVPGVAADAGLGAGGPRRRARPAHRPGRARARRTGRRRVGERRGRHRQEPARAGAGARGVRARLHRAHGPCGHVGAPELWPWRQVFTALGEQIGPLRRDVDPLFAVGAAGDFATWDALARALRREARERPLLVVLEDVHEADEPTLRLLQHLVRRPRTSGSCGRHPARRRRGRRAARAGGGGGRPPRRHAVDVEGAGAGRRPRPAAHRPPAPPRTPRWRPRGATARAATRSSWWSSRSPAAR